MHKTSQNSQQHDGQGHGNVCGAGYGWMPGIRRFDRTSVQGHYWAESISLEFKPLIVGTERQKPVILKEKYGCN